MSSMSFSVALPLTSMSPSPGNRSKVEDHVPGGPRFVVPVTASVPVLSVMLPAVAA